MLFNEFDRFDVRGNHAAVTHGLFDRDKRQIEDLLTGVVGHAPSQARASDGLAPLFNSWPLTFSRSLMTQRSAGSARGTFFGLPSWPLMASPDQITAIQRLAAQKGYRISKASRRDAWFLVTEDTHELALSDTGNTTFSEDEALQFLLRKADRKTSGGLKGDQ